MSSQGPSGTSSLTSSSSASTSTDATATPSSDQSSSTWSNATVIVGFLVIFAAVFGGLFIAGIILCSVRNRRRDGLDGGAGEQRTPKLWEKCINSDPVQSYQWEDVLPLAAEVRRQRGEPAEHHKNKLVMRHDGSSWKGRARHLLAPSRILENSPAPVHDSRAEGVQVAMIILMPVAPAAEPQVDIDQSPRHTSVLSEGEVPYEYSIGMVRVPYDDDDLDTLL